jgi:hypothetical protein
MHSFGPNSRPEHLQLYFYDDDPSLIHRKEATKDLDQEVVRKVVDILRGNPYSEKFRSLGAYKDNLENYRIELNTDKKLDQRRYNLPVSSEVAAIWVEGSDLANRFKRSIILYGDNNERHSIQATQGCYDPLSYPLFFPKGELGWHPNLPKRDTPWHVAQKSREDRDDEGLAVQDTSTFFVYPLRILPNLVFLCLSHRWRWQYMRLRQRLLLLPTTDAAGYIQPHTTWWALVPTVCGRHVHKD